VTHQTSYGTLAGVHTRTLPQESSEVSQTSSIDLPELATFQSPNTQSEIPRGCGNFEASRNATERRVGEKRIRNDGIVPKWWLKSSSANMTLECQLDTLRRVCQGTLDTQMSLLTIIRRGHSWKRWRIQYLVRYMTSSKPPLRGRGSVKWSLHPKQNNL
jgi:hypothetical protein